MNRMMLACLALIVVSISGATLKTGEFRKLKKENYYLKAASQNYIWGNFTECSKTCGKGFMSRDKLCLVANTLDTYTTCDTDFYSCNHNLCQDPFEGTLFSACSKSCGGGEKFRFNRDESVKQTIRCNTHSCDKAFSNCEADLMFVLDSSGSIGADQFPIVKQFSMDVVSSIPVGPNSTHIGAISFSTTVSVDMHLDDDQHKDVVKDNLWKLPFLAGVTNTADAIMEMREMSTTHKRDDKTQVAIVLTDGHSNVDPSRTVPEAKLAHNDGIEIIVIGVGLVKEDVEMMGIASNSDSYYPVPNVEAIMDITNRIVNDTCRKATPECDDCVYTECTAACGDYGLVYGERECRRTIGNVNIVKTIICEELTCEGKCTTTPEATTTTPTTTTPTTTTPVTTTTPEVTTTTPESIVDCSKCDFTQGQIWRPDDANCHGFFVCEPSEVKGKYRVTRMTCGHLFWDQSLLTCVQEAPAQCQDPDVDPVVTVKSDTSTVAPFCPYIANPANRHQFKYEFGSHDYVDCPEGLFFDAGHHVCACVRKEDFVDPCSNEMLLHFPYDLHLHDVTCRKARSVTVGQGPVVLVNDPSRSTVAQFSGKSYLEVPFMRNYLAGNTVQALSIAFFFKATSVNAKGVVVSNGDCKEKASYEVGYEFGNTFFRGETSNSLVRNVPLLGQVASDVWYHVAWVYNGQTLSTYLDGVRVGQESMNGGLANTDVPMAVGARCGEFLHKGLVDEVRVYARELSASEVLALSQQ